jgi:hypothetical protein
LDLKNTGWDSVGWIDLAQDRDKYWIVLNMVMNLQIPQNAGHVLTICKILASLERTCPMELVC